jgi:hypothetical protein
MQNLFYPAAGVAVAIAAGLFNPAYADWAETKANSAANTGHSATP